MTHAYINPRRTRLEKSYEIKPYSQSLLEEPSGSANIADDDSKGLGGTMGATGAAVTIDGFAARLKARHRFA